MLTLEEKHKKIVLDILEKFVPGAEIRAFGSRVTGGAKKHSDLDLVVMTEKPIPYLQMARLREEFRESMLPFEVDVLDWSNIPGHFKEMIVKTSIILRPPARHT